MQILEIKEVGQNLANFPNELNYVIIPVIILVIFLIYRSRFNLKKGTSKFKVAFLMVLSNLFLLLIAVFAIGTMNLEIISTIVSYALGTAFFLYTLYFTIKVLDLHEKTIKNMLIESSETSIDVANIATELAASSNEVNAAAEEIASTTQNIFINSKKVMSSTDDIQKLMSLIINISEQTNLLALNASIEAGRAGEYGRGFAVVADEVRKLAEESKTSIKNSSEKIDEIIQQIRDTYMEMEGISASTEEQTSSMEEINSTAERLSALAEELKTSLNQYANDIESTKTKAKVQPKSNDYLNIII